MWQRSVLVSFVEGLDVLENADSTIDGFVVPHLDSGALIDQVVVQIAEVEVHGSIDRLGE